MEFRKRLLRTLEAIQPVLEQPGVLVAGSEVPNLLEREAASTLVVSEDVDIAVPVEAHAGVKSTLSRVEGFRALEEEPSVLVPDDDALIEVNFVGLDRRLEPGDPAYVLEDAQLPLMVFSQLSLLVPGERKVVDGIAIPLPRLAGLLLEKLMTDRSGRKGDRDLLVVAGLIALADERALDEVVARCAQLPAEHQHAVRSNLTVLSLLPRSEHMPDPAPVRASIATLLSRLDRGGAA